MVCGEMLMLMLTCNDRGSSFNNHVIIHEYTHGVSNRLSGGPANVDCLRIGLF
jgi:extracellular elastinolytic metalloproteinase